jgi:hypothetical protein
MPTRGKRDCVSGCVGAATAGPRRARTLARPNKGRAAPRGQQERTCKVKAWPPSQASGVPEIDDTVGVAPEAASTRAQVRNLSSGAAILLRAQMNKNRPPDSGTMAGFLTAVVALASALGLAGATPTVTGIVGGLFDCEGGNVFTLTVRGRVAARLRACSEQPGRARGHTFTSDWPGSREPAAVLIANCRALHLGLRATQPS